jgi:F-type H+-transporting ATPase subunit a
LNHTIPLLKARLELANVFGMVEISKEVLIRIPKLGGLDLSITNEVVLLWIAALITAALLIGTGRQKRLVPSGMLPNLFEGLIVFIEKEVLQETFGAQGRKWATFLLSLFFFILFTNLMGMIPLPTHVKAMTSSLSVTAGFALIVFLLTILVNIRQNGVKSFFARFIPAGVPRWLYVLVIPIEIVSWLARPLSLSIRLFANMLVGHFLLMVFIGLAMTSAWYFKALPFVGAVAMGMFEIFVGFIQAFIFTMLAAIYLKDATEQEH